MGDTMSRRTVGGMLAALAVGPGTLPAAGQGAQQATSVAGTDRVIDGVAGGGVLRRMGVDVPFSLMAFSAPGPDSTPVLGGFLRLVDDTTPNHPLVIEAMEIVSLDPLADLPSTGRRATGWGTLNGHGRYPFILRVEDLGAPGSGEDTFDLVFGAAAEPFLDDDDASVSGSSGLGYSIRSKVARGDLSLLAQP